MDLLFLGTVAGVPSKTRNVSAIALIEDQSSNWFLIDCGEGTQHQINHTNLSLNNLKMILITHVHGDHSYGLPGLLASSGLNGRTEPLTIIAPHGIKEWFESTLKNTNLYLPFEINFVVVENLKSYEFSGYKIDVVRLSHRVPSYGYSFSELSAQPVLDVKKLQEDELPKGPLWGKIKNGKDVEHEGKIFLCKNYVKFDRKPRKIVICGDNDDPFLLSESAEDADVLVHESTFAKDLKTRAGEGGHSYAEIVGEFAESADIPNLVLTHFSSRYLSSSENSLSLEDLYNEAKSVYSGDLFLADDFQRYRLGKNGEFGPVNIQVK